MQTFRPNGVKAFVRSVRSDGPLIIRYGTESESTAAARIALVW